ncbi:hypothetical protein [Brevundimonas sp. NIBR11]|uniref:hypothetical protein n=1 Tax=Brevundimonas sp. NIBR11 TaxID=3015999 RepID=UPI0022F04ED7|nr:hypothetical protein [Brevundimonas sp. NIBR11]
MAAFASVTLGGCEHLLKKNPNWSDQVAASSDGWIFQPGRHILANGGIMEMRSDGLSFSQPFRSIEVEAVDPQPAVPGPDSREFSGGKTYRIVDFDCDADWSSCEPLKASTVLTVTPVGIVRTALIGAPGYRSVGGRQFDLVFVSISGGGVGYSASLERQSMESH